MGRSDFDLNARNWRGLKYINVKNASLSPGRLPGKPENTKAKARKSGRKAGREEEAGESAVEAGRRGAAQTYDNAAKADAVGGPRANDVGLEAPICGSAVHAGLFPEPLLVCFPGKLHPSMGLRS